MDAARRRLRELLEARGLRDERLETVLAALEASGDLSGTDPLEALAAGVVLGLRIGRSASGPPEAETGALGGGLRRFEAQIAELQAVLRRVAEQLERRRRDREAAGTRPPRTLH